MYITVKIKDDKVNDFYKVVENSDFLSEISVPVSISLDTFDELMRGAIGNEFNIHDFFVRSRELDYVKCRAIYAGLAKKHTKAVLKKIGLKMGGRDHSTVLNAISTCNCWIDTDASFRQQYKQLEMRLLDLIRET